MIVKIFENEDLIVIDKPAGMLVHSKGDFNPEYTVSDYAADNGAKFDDDHNRVGIVHRLDRHTSGVMVLAKNSKTMRAIQSQFASRSVRKTYLAVTEGNLKEANFKIDIPLARSKNNPKTFMADNDGKEAITNIQLIASKQANDLLLLSPVTGRTHQLRAHLNYIKHPIIGDTSYGSKTKLESGRFLLHAYSINFELPGDTKQTFVANIPKDMSTYIDEDDQEAIHKLTS